ncbi:hypothetical protein, partial [Enterobacter roggenkampii]
VLTEGSGAPGTYTTTLTPTVAGMKTLGTGGLGSFNLTTTLNVTASVPDAGTSTLTASPSSVMAGQGSTV